MLIQKQYNNLALLEIQIEQEVQKCFSLLKKQKKKKEQFQIFQKEQLKYYDFNSFKYNIDIKI